MCEAMARPKKSERREHQLNLKLTEREITWVRGRAASASMSSVGFGRAQLLAERPVRPQPGKSPGHLDPLFLIALSRIGNNLNQIARRMHEFRMPAPPALEPLLESIREIIRKASADGP
jgi:hypothetical protein